MSQSAMQEITCPKCGKKHSFQVWDSINTLEFPEMKEKVRNDEAFRYRCPDCGATALLNYNFLYHQQEDKILIFVDADGSSYGDMEKILKQRGNAFDGYRKRIVLSYNDFKEKLLIFDAGLDDRIVEIIKSSIWDNVEERYKDKHIDEIYFATNEDGENGFLSGKKVTWWRPWSLTRLFTMPSKKRPFPVSMPFPEMISLSTEIGPKPL